MSTALSRALATGLSAGLATLLVALSGAAQAGAPQAKGRTPGRWGMPLGDFEVTALSDIEGRTGLPSHHGSGG